MERRLLLSSSGKGNSCSHIPTSSEDENICKRITFNPHELWTEYLGDSITTNLIQQKSIGLITRAFVAIPTWSCCGSTQSSTRYVPRSHDFSLGGSQKLHQVKGSAYRHYQVHEELVTFLQQQTAELIEKLVGLALTSNAAEVTRYKNLKKLICSVCSNCGKTSFFWSRLNQVEIAYHFFLDSYNERLLLH